VNTPLPATYFISSSDKTAYSPLPTPELNWSLGRLTSRSRDNLKNPITAAGNPYVPTNSPAIGDLMDMFDFHGNHED
jgi:hypothetical protein